MDTNSCETCEHSIFDEVWGEYKCELLYRRIYRPEEMSNCSMFKPKPKEK